MNIPEVISMMEAHKVTWMKIKDFNGYQQAFIQEADTPAVVSKFQEYLPMLKACKKINIQAKTKPGVKDDAAGTFNWNVDLEPGASAASASAIAGPFGGLGFNDILSLVKSASDARIEGIEKEYKLRSEYDQRIRKLEDGGGIWEKILPLAAPGILKAMGLTESEMALAYKQPATRVAGTDTMTKQTNTKTFEAKPREEMIKFLLESKNGYTESFLESLNDTQLANQYQACYAMYADVANMEKQEEEMANKCLEKLIQLKQKGWTMQQILDLLEASSKLTDIKEPATLVELVQRGLKSPDAISDALIVLRIKQGA
jgi:hypothetical protein